MVMTKYADDRMKLPSPSSIVDTMRDMRQQYDAGAETKWLPRPEDMPTSGAGHDYHIRDEHRLLYALELSRNLEKNDPVVGQGINRFVNNVIQGGYTYMPESGIDAVDRLNRERWEDWTDDENVLGVDFYRKDNWRKHEELTARKMVTDGDLIELPLGDGRLQAFEAHRIRSPIRFNNNRLRRRRNVIHGVETTNGEQVQKYWLTRREYDGFNQSFFSGTNFATEVVGVQAWADDPLTGKVEKNAFHIFNDKHFSQHRGVPWMAAVLNTAGMHGDLQFAKLVQAQMASVLGFIHKIDRSVTDYVAPEYDLDPSTGQPMGPELAPGMSYWPRYPGETIDSFSSNIPNAEFFPHAKILLTFVALSIDMPLILFLLDATETNFSAWRGAFEQFKIAATRFQQHHCSVFHKPVMRWKQRQWLRQDRLMQSIPQRDYFHHTWQFPRWSHVQPLEDVKAEVLELGNMLESPRAIAARHNRDYDRIINDTCADRMKTILCGIEAAQQINEHPYIQANPHEIVTWREITSLPLSDSAQMQLLTGDPSGSDSPGLETQGTQQ